jgi:hypothetical protein
MIFDIIKLLFISVRLFWQVLKLKLFVRLRSMNGVEIMIVMIFEENSFTRLLRLLLKMKVNCYLLTVMSTNFCLLDQD